MNKRYKGKMDIEIDGFMLLLIGIFVILPLGRCLVRKLPGGSEAPTSVTVDRETPTETVSKEPVSTTSSIRYGDFKMISLSDESSSVGVNDGVRFKVEDNVVRISLKSPSGKEGKLKFKKYFNGRNACVIFDEEGTWELTFLDKDGFALSWYKINVY